MKKSTQQKGTIMREHRIDEVSGRTRHQAESRAAELALLRGVTDGTYAPEDLARARHELTGDAIETQDPGNDTDTVGVSRDLAEPPDDRGHQVEDIPPDDEESAPERLALEGVDAAEHDRMVAARHKRSDRQP